MPSSVCVCVCVCVCTHLPQVQWAGWTWVTRSYTFKAQDMCVILGPRTRKSP